MTTATRGPTITARGRELDPSTTALGELRGSFPETDPAELRKRLLADGYLFLPGYLARAEVLRARHDLLERLDHLGWLMPGTDTDEAVPGPLFERSFLPSIADESPRLRRLLFSGRMMQLHERVFGESVLHFDYMWFRAFPPGPATPPHMDSVFMNRGTLDLLTAWTPLGDIDRTLGGLAILEGSHTLDEVRQSYGSRDVDVFCTNHGGAEEKAGHDGLIWDGALSDDPVGLREQLGGRWLTTDFKAGDVLVFTIFTVHCGLDNNADRLRLSCDSRYQPASQPADPRWVGTNPTAHSRRSKRGVIC